MRGQAQAGRFTFLICFFPMFFFTKLKRIFRRRGFGRSGEIFPDEIFLDSSNLPDFNRYQFEGRLEQPISRRVLVYLGLFLAVIFAVFLGKVWSLQIIHGEELNSRSRLNSLRHVPIFPNRGVIYDRNNFLLVENSPSAKHPEFADRTYKNISGLAHILGFVSYPKKDSSGFYYNLNSDGRDGVELLFNETLSGSIGVKLIEVDALGEIDSESVIYPPTDGLSLYLSIDQGLTSALHQNIENLAERVGFTGGAGVILDIKTGEVLASTSYPEFDSTILTEGRDDKAISRYREDKAKPFLNRATAGLYTPGSIVKPYVAVGVLEEGVIEPDKNILSTGSISIPNPYDKSKKSVFNDWKAHGYVDMRKALAVSSNVYFFEVGGGFEEQGGLGIERLEKYFRLFGFGESILGDIFSNKSGIIPSPKWKAEAFPDEPWRIGDTYNTSIGQYGFLVTPLQAVRAVAAIGNGGFLVYPTLLRLDGKAGEKVKTGLNPANLAVVREGMREGVISGTASGLYFSDLAVAAKTGTAELDAAKKFVNSWVTGFFPYENPRFAFAVLMEKGPRGNVFGALSVMRSVFEWMQINTPEYLRN